MARQTKNTLDTMEELQENQQESATNYSSRLEGLKSQAALLIEDELIPVLDNLFEVAPDFNAVQWSQVLDEYSEIYMNGPLAQFKPQPFPDGYSADENDELENCQDFYEIHELAKLVHEDAITALNKVYYKAEEIAETVKFAYGDDLLITASRDELIFSEEF